MTTASLAPVISLDSRRVLADAQRRARVRRNERQEAMRRHPSFASRRAAVTPSADASYRG